MTEGKRVGQDQFSRIWTWCSGDLAWSSRGSGFKYAPLPHPLRQDVVFLFCFSRFYSVLAMRVILLLLFLGLCCGHPALYHSGSLAPQRMDAQLSLLGKRDGTTLCLVVPADGTDQNLIDRLEKSIKSATGLSDIHSWSTDGELMWYHVHLTQTEAKKLEENSDVAYVEVDEGTETHEAPPEDDDWAVDSPDLHARSVFERDQQYATQENAATELLVISTPPDRDYSCYDDYTYPKEAGKGIYIYHIEDVSDFQCSLPKDPSRCYLGLSLTDFLHTGNPETIFPGQ